MAVKRKYRLNLRNYGNLPAIMLSQYDEGYALEFEIRDGTDAASDLSAYTVTLKGTRADTLAYSFAGTVSTNVLTFVIDTTMTACDGRGTAEIAIKDTANDVLFATFNMPVFVERAAVPEGSIDADVERAQEIAEQVQEIVDNAAAAVSGEAEKWATGQINGTDVPSTDPTYENNAKYYAEQAETAAASIGIDATLTQTGKAADAKKTGDEITALKEDLNAISNGDYVYAEFTTGKYITTNVDPININSPVTNSSYRYCILDASEGDKFKINIFDGGAARAYCFIDATSNVLSVSSGSSKVLDMVITAPANTAKLVLNDKTASGHYAYKVSHLIERIDDIDAEIDILQENPIFRKGQSYNLVDFVDMYYNHKYYSANGGSYTDDTSIHTTKGLIPVTAGNYVISDKHLYEVCFFGQDGTYVSNWRSLNNSKAWEAVEIPSNIYYCKPQWVSATSIGTATGLADGDIPSFYYVEQYGAQSDHKPAKPKTLIDGRYITDSVFGVISPSERSFFDLMTRCREIKRNNRERGAVRIGTFNIYGAMIKYINWPVVKDICTEYGLDACGFQEVTNSAEKWTGDVNKYSFSQSMMGGSFAYSNLSNDPDGAAVRILSGLTMTDGEFTTLSYTFGNVEKTAPLSHALISIPNYHHARDWGKVISMYTVHLPTTGNEARIILNLIADVIAADMHDYKMLVADTNCFRVDAETQKPWCWAYFENMGLYPSATDFTKSTYCYPLTTAQWSTSNLDFIDNVFITDNMKCIDWGIADAKDYPIAGVSGGYVSDHCMLYADIIFDFVDGFNDV